MKILKAAAALCCMMMAATFIACSDNDDTSVSSTGSATLTVNTIDVFEKLQYASYVSANVFEYSDNLFAGVNALFYDTQGQLVRQYMDISSTLDPIKIKAEGLPAGKYKVVVVQYNVGADSLSDTWKLVDTERLTDLRIERLDYSIPPAFPDVVGLAIMDIEVGKGNTMKVISPNPAGGLIAFQYEGQFPHFQFYGVGLCVQHEPMGLYLDPARSGDDRYFYDPKERETQYFDVAHVGTMYGGETPLTRRTGSGLFFSLWTGRQRTYDVVVNDNDPDEPGWLLFGQGQLDVTTDAIAMFYYDLDCWNFNYIYTGTQVGFSEWYAHKNDPMQLIPCLNWGSTLDEVKQYIKEIQGDTTDLNYGLYEDGNWGWTFYHDLAPRLDEGYVFETETGENLKAVVVTCYAGNPDIKHFADGLVLQGYTFVKEEDGSHFYTSPDGTTTAEVFIHKSYYDEDEYESLMLVYYPTGTDSPFISEAKYVNRAAKNVPSFGLADALESRENREARIKKFIIRN